MKRYKLIKEYPGSPALGKIVSRAENHSTYNYDEGNFTTAILNAHVEENENYWEEVVVENTYEVLSIVGISSKRIYYKKDDAFVSAASKRSITTFPYGSHGCKIHSVKRLSDGEVFTLGDTLKANSFKYGIANPDSEEFYNNLISKIAVVKDCFKEVAGYHGDQNEKLMFSVNNIYGKLNVTLEEAVKYKEPLFTTHDGVEIYDMEGFKEIYGVSLKSIGDHCILKGATIGISDLPSENRVWFYRREEAELYYSRNTPKLSYNEVLKIVGMRALQEREALLKLIEKNSSYNFLVK